MSESFRADVEVRDGYGGYEVLRGAEVRATEVTNRGGKSTRTSYRYNDNGRWRFCKLLKKTDEGADPAPRAPAAPRAKKQVAEQKSGWAEIRERFS